jgi:hypothetical protein
MAKSCPEIQNYDLPLCLAIELGSLAPLFGFSGDDHLIVSFAAG